MFDSRICTLVPGPELAAAIAACDLSGLDAGETLSVVAACRRLTPPGPAR
ncbi:MAG: hypothetical protein ACRDP1_12885 [Nocardioidaceae bacterium]